MKKLLGILFLGLIIGSCSESTTKEESSLTENTAVQHTDSLGWINEQIIKTPNKSELYLLKAQYLLKNRDLKSSIAEIDRAISIDSTNLKFILFKADALYEAKDLLDAKTTYLQSLKIDQANIHANIQMAWISLISGLHEECFQYANAALKVNQYIPEPYYLKGLAYKELGNFKLSVSNFRTATEQDNDYLIAWLQLGYMYDTAEDTLAGAFYENALRIDSNNIDALYAFGMHLQTWGISQDAITQYQHIIRLNDGYHDAYYNIGYIYLEMIHQNDSAIKYYDKVVALNPYNYKGYYNRGLSFERNNQIQYARADFEKTLELKPDYTPAAKAMSRINGN